MTELVEPGGCRRCGIPLRQHFRRWTRGVGRHTWEPPTNQQREERAARTTAATITAAQRRTPR